MSDAPRTRNQQVDSIPSSQATTGARNRAKSRLEMLRQLSRIRNEYVEPMRQEAERIQDKVVTTGRLEKVIKTRKASEAANAKLARYLRLYDNLYKKYS